MNKIQRRLPSDLGKTLPNLQIFDIASNQYFGSLPLSLSNATSLRLFEIQYNNLTGQMPDFRKLHNLEQFIIQQNLLGSGTDGDLTFVSDLTNATELKQLIINDNHFGGTLPTSISNLSTKLERFWFYRNQIHGSIPTGIGNLVSLESLSMWENSFAGSIPTEIQKLSSLVKLDISMNALSGSIPSSLGNLTKLCNLYLQGNNLEGVIPSSLGNCQRLIFLDLSNNNLSGAIPQQVIGLPSLSIYLNLSKNNFTGSLPMEVGKLKSLGVLDVSNNMLSGELPSSLGSCESLEVLHLQGNFFKGPIPSSMIGLKAIEELDLSRNNLSGSFGSVYKGILDDNDKHQLVSVKVFNLLRHGASKSFMAECEALRNIKHRNLVEIITACSSVDFNEVREALNLEQRLDIAIDIACALDYLHNHCETPIVHCDLKPSNVLLDNEMTGHVSDFGLARFLSQEAGINVSNNHTSSIGIKGTVGYAAPEYGMGSEVSTNGDVYSFGILLLEIFAGKRPTDDMFNGDLNLHTSVKMAFPERVMEIADSTLFEGGISERRVQKIEVCLNSIFRIGIECSAESPTDRLKNISDAASELRFIRDVLLG
ncbi:putative LRR receptor-like serine/threonine-protein kinase [Prunus yedoensis var. nudiflora]|uniref:non-specific serine/threonine protein kinase n=1 Tax=Prunus yedoensis var. nudiflora TaxID=2094558 RepID=A0A314Z066_PRUYE|nr:putative LRR receptor-like serine/threonine-protein kinase [Prunus yedoensis var. nudiflora]